MNEFGIWIVLAPMLILSYVWVGYLKRFQRKFSPDKLDCIPGVGVEETKIQLSLLTSIPKYVVGMTVLLVVISLISYLIGVPAGLIVSALGVMIPATLQQVSVLLESRYTFDFVTRLVVCIFPTSIATLVSVMTVVVMPIVEKWLSINTVVTNKLLLSNKPIGGRLNTPAFTLGLVGTIGLIVLITGLLYYKKVRELKTMVETEDKMQGL